MNQIRTGNPHPLRTKKYFLFINEPVQELSTKHKQKIRLQEEQKKYDTKKLS